MSAFHPQRSFQPGVRFRPIADIQSIAPRGWAPHNPIVVDREKRDIASLLVRRFLAGAITSDELETEWPSNKADPALEAVGSMVWLFYDDHRPRRMLGKQAASSEERELLTRYAAYLESDIAYEWPESNFIRLGGLGALVPLSLGLLWPLDRWIKARNARLDAQMDAHGDLSFWPFTRREQWTGQPLPPYVR
jgi:hypothetical protein